MEISGLPIHVLLLHFAVVLAPLFALCALAYVLRGAWRSRLGVPTLVLGVVATLATLGTGHFGEELQKAMPAEDAIKTHALYGGIAEKVVAVLLVAFLIAFFAFDGPRQKRVGFLRAMYGNRGWQIAGQVLTVLAALATLVLITLAGHSGAYSAWNGWRNR